MTCRWTVSDGDSLSFIGENWSLCGSIVVKCNQSSCSLSLCKGSWVKPSGQAGNENWKDNSSVLRQTLGQWAQTLCGGQRESQSLWKVTDLWPRKLHTWEVNLGPWSDDVLRDFIHCEFCMKYHFDGIFNWEGRMLLGFLWLIQLYVSSVSSLPTLTCYWHVSPLCLISLGPILLGLNPVHCPLCCPDWRWPKNLSYSLFSILS